MKGALRVAEQLLGAPLLPDHASSAAKVRKSVSQNVSYFMSFKSTRALLGRSH